MLYANKKVLRIDNIEIENKIVIVFLRLYHYMFLVPPKRKNSGEHVIIGSKNWAEPGKLFPGLYLLLLCHNVVTSDNIIGLPTPSCCIDPPRTTIINAQTGLLHKCNHYEHFGHILHCWYILQRQLASFDFPFWFFFFFCSNTVVFVTAADTCYSSFACVHREDFFIQQCPNGPSYQWTNPVNLNHEKI